MITLQSINSEINSAQIAISDVELQLSSINDNISIYKIYLVKELVNGLLKTNALMYENMPPTQKIILKLDIPSEYILGNPYLTRIYTAFNSAGKVFELYCNGVLV